MFQIRRDNDSKAPPLLVVVDSATAADGSLRISGWALASIPVVSIEVHSARRRLGAATYGLSRPDVAKIYPVYPNAAACGYTFLLSVLDKVPDFLKLVIIEQDGHTTTIKLDRPTVLPEPPALQANPIMLQVDRAVCDVNGSLLVEGWAFSAPGIDRIDVIAPSGKLGSAPCQVRRLDVRAAHSGRINRDETGYRFTGQLDNPPGAPMTLVVRAWSGDLSAEMPVLVEFDARRSRTGRAIAPAAAAAEPEFRVFIDTPEAVDGFAKETVKQRIHVNGWALARAGVERVEIFLDDVFLGSAYYGIGRPDLQLAWPDWSDASRGGFAYVIPSRVLRNGSHTLRVTVVDRRGASQSQEIRIDVKLADPRAAHSRLRSRVPFAETSLLMENLRRAGPLPQFNIVIPIQEGWRAGLESTLQALRLQTYPNWMALLVHQGGPGELRRLREVISTRPQAVKERTRIREAAAFEWMEFNEAGEGSQLARPQRLMVMAPGDVLAADALMAFALEAKDGTCDFAYSDDRRWNSSEESTLPFFKPAWSPETLLSFNYIGTAWVTNLELARRCFATPQDLVRESAYGRTLRLTEAATSIRRIPRLLFEATVSSAEERGDAAALRAAVRRRGIDAKVSEGLVPGTFRVQRSLAPGARVSIIIPTIAARGLIAQCVESIRKQSADVAVEVVLLNNLRKPDRKWTAWFKRNADKVIEIDEPFNWSRFNNIGRKHATGEYLLFLNDDIEALHSRWLGALLEVAQAAEVGVVGPQLLYADGKVQHAGMFLARDGIARHAFRFADKDEPGYFGLARTQRNVSAVTGACMMMRASVFDQMGGFDERHDIVNNDLDFCLRVLSNGLQVVYTPHARLCHHEQASRAGMRDDYDTSAFMRAWGRAFLHGDPYFNPNLSLDFDDYVPESEPVEEVYAGSPIADAQSVQRILVVKLDHIGDFITALPAIRRLKQAFPHASISALVGPAVAPLARAQPDFDEVHTLSFFHARSSLGKTTLTDEDLHDLRRKLEPVAFDLAVDLRKHHETRHVLHYTGARLTAGFDKAGEFPWLDIALQWEGDRAFEDKRTHITTDLLNLVSAIENAVSGDRVIFARESLKPPPAAIVKRFPQLFKKAVVCVHPAAGNSLKQWPPAQFGKLLDLLLSTHDVHVAIVGGPDEVALASEVAGAAASRDRIWILAGELKLAELPDLIGACALFVGNDSGPKHVAGALGVPTVAVHSDSVSCEEWGPFGPRAIAIRRRMECGPCYYAQREQCSRDVACMSGIEPRHVYSACLTATVLPERVESP